MTVAGGSRVRYAGGRRGSDDALDSTARRSVFPRESLAHAENVPGYFCVSRCILVKPQRPWSLPFSLPAATSARWTVTRDPGFDATISRPSTISLSHRTSATGQVKGDRKRCSSEALSHKLTHQALSLPVLPSTPASKAIIPLRPPCVDFVRAALDPRLTIWVLPIADMPCACPGPDEGSHPWLDWRPGTRSRTDAPLPGSRVGLGGSLPSATVLYN